MHYSQIVAVMTKYRRNAKLQTAKLHAAIVFLALVHYQADLVTLKLHVELVLFLTEFNSPLNILV